jgi:vacuolar iron transporter family protein
MPKEPPSDLEASHTPATIRVRLAGPYDAESYVSDFIYGAIDGTVTTFAVVAGVAGAGLNDNVIILLGVANLAADGFSMAASNFLGTRADDQAREKARLEEEDHIDRYPEGEREEIRQIFHEKGFRHDDLQRIVEVITGDRQRWIETMLREEYGYSAHQRSAWKAGLVTFGAFLIVGTIPLVSYLINGLTNVSIADPFLWSSVLTGVAFVIVGAMKSRFAVQHWFVSAVETLCVGGLAATIAYVLGEALKSLV